MVRIMCEAGQKIFIMGLIGCGAFNPGRHLFMQMITSGVFLNFDEVKHIDLLASNPKG